MSGGVITFLQMGKAYTLAVYLLKDMKTHKTMLYTGGINENKEGKEREREE